MNNKVLWWGLCDSGSVRAALSLDAVGKCGAPTTADKEAHLDKSALFQTTSP